MKLHELEHKKDEIRSTISTTINAFILTILACYADDYSQKDEIVIEGQIPHVSAEDILRFGIRSSVVEYRTEIYTREYILFVDNTVDVSSAEAFENYADKFCSRYLPKGVGPGLFTFRFEVESQDAFESFANVVRGKYPEIRPLFSFNHLLKEKRFQERLEAKLRLIGNQYNHFLFSSSTYKKIAGFMSSSSSQGHRLVCDFYDRLNDLATHELAGKNLIVNNFVPTSNETNHVRKNRQMEEQERYLSLALAYLTFKYRIPVLVDDSLRSYVTLLKSFYCSYDAYTAFDKVRLLREYPKLCYSNRSLLDFLVYVEPENRVLSATIEYLADSQIRAEKVNLFEVGIHSMRDEAEFEADLVALEEKSPQHCFLHVGNCLYMDVDGVRRLVHLIEISASFNSIVSSCDEVITPFKKELNLVHLKDMLPCNALAYHKDSEKESLLRRFVRFLYHVSDKGQIGKLDLKTGLDMYIPAYAEDGLGPIVAEITKMKGNQFECSGISKRLLDQYGHYSTKMRNEIIDRVVEIVPLKNLRKSGEYLTIWGANSMLLLKNDLFKTIGAE